MIEQPTFAELLNAYSILNRYQDLDLTAIQNLDELLIYVPSVGRQIFTLLREYGQQSRGLEFLPFDLPPKNLLPEPILSITKNVGTGSLSVTGREKGLMIQKWNEREKPTFDLNEPNLLKFLQPDLEVLVPTLKPFALYAVTYGESIQGIYPVKNPEERETQQEYAKILQVLLSEFMLALAGDERS